MSDAKIPGSLAEDIMLGNIRTAWQLKERLDAGEDPNRPDKDNPEFQMTPLSAAARNLDAECIELLLAAGADHRPGGYCDHTALHWAAMGQTWPGAVKLLVKAGADLEAKDWEGCTPLHRAAQYSKGTECRVVAALLDLGADPRALDNNGKTPAQTSETKNARDLLKRAAAASELADEVAQPTAPPRDRRRMAKGEAENQ